MFIFYTLSADDLISIELDDLANTNRKQNPN